MELRKIAVLFLLISLISGCGVAAKYRIVTRDEDVEIMLPMKELRVGERFTYKAEWLGLDVGIATLSVKEITERNGRKVYHILATAQSTPIISKIYKVEDEISTYIDVEGLYPVRFEKKQREGGYRSDEYTDFDHKKGTAFYFSRLNHTKKEYNIPKKVQDTLSCLYYFRLQDADVGKSIFANVIADEKNYLLEAKIHKKGVIRIKGVGEWEAFMVEPLPWFQGKIKRKAKATMWLSADEKRIPLLMVTRGIPFVGTVTITLQKIEDLDSESQ
ncbi:MAG: DUF3108 domain-containing protein [Candidatus Omnitrophica bacterium]|nr:DUF3108 domain-containing protein [Candidatus Omnitrophota bacterium]